MLREPQHVVPHGALGPWLALHTLLPLFSGAGGIGEGRGQERRPRHRTEQRQPTIIPPRAPTQQAASCSPWARYGQYLTPLGIIDNTITF